VKEIALVRSPAGRIDRDAPTQVLGATAQRIDPVGLDLDRMSKVCSPHADGAARVRTASAHRTELEESGRREPLITLGAALTPSAE
jgi:hypothetical protein